MIDKHTLRVNLGVKEDTGEHPCSAAGLCREYIDAPASRGLVFNFRSMRSTSASDEVQYFVTHLPPTPREGIHTTARFIEQATDAQPGMPNINRL